MSISWSTVGAVACAAAALYLFFSKNKTLQRKPPSTTQELIRYKNISEDGIIELDNHQYRLMIEVEPVNMALKSQAEQEALWIGFRDLINALTVPATFLVQTRNLDLKDYVSELQSVVNKALTPQLKEYGDDLCTFLTEKTEKNVRDRRHYIILKMDALAVSSIDSGIMIENDALNTLMSDLMPKRTGRMSSDEIRNLAHQELDNMSGIIQGCLNGMEIPNVRLNNIGVMDVIYSTLNRDLAPHARLHEADSQEMFSLTTRSLTPFLMGGDKQNVSETDEQSEKVETKKTKAG